MRRRQGTVAQLIVFAAVVAFVILPLTVSFVLQMHSWVLLRQAQQKLDQALLPVQLCLDRQALASGELKLYGSEVQDFLEQNFRENIGEVLLERLEYFHVHIIMRPAPRVAGHWREGEDAYWPEVMAVAGIKVHRGQIVEIRRSVWLIMD